MDRFTLEADGEEAASSAGRVGWIDGARGLSIALMIVSHIGMFTATTPGWFHLYVMRPVAPFFLLLLGLLWRPGFRARHLDFIVGMVVAQVLALELGFAFPNILAVMGMCLLLMPLAVRWPLAAVSLAVTQLVFWPHPGWWTGYPLGFALVLVLAGQTIGADRYLVGYGRIGSRLGLEVVGRYPLTFYLGHLLALYGASRFLALST